ncbi:hypothetical protein ACFVRB_41430 [Streptomyces nojiriensis]|uniref:hypothetical protein n=1 Tax=Streptomyces nojiriensis TaxID=66374 RepID=UPI0036D8923B
MTTGNASTASLDLDGTERVRLAVYRGFARTGKAPGAAELAALTGLGPDRVRRELRTLHERHDLVLDREDSDHVVMAHPLASVPRRAWDDVVRTCANQRLFCSTDCVDARLRRTGQERGHVMDLATLWHFAGDWYTGRLDPGYTRRDPAAATAYFAGVGLRGPFRGLPD